jgi:hypothetical protein
MSTEAECAARITPEEATALVGEWEKHLTIQDDGVLAVRHWYGHIDADETPLNRNEKALRLFTSNMVALVGVLRRAAADVEAAVSPTLRRLGVEGRMWTPAEARDTALEVVGETGEDVKTISAMYYIQKLLAQLRRAQKAEEN